jgi:uncharacterized protein
MSETDQTAVIAFLADPATHGAASVERIDTHASIVFLAGEHAYKLKRAVRYSYLDYSTVAMRERYCRAELALNRRTAPQLYEDVRPVARDVHGRLSLGGPGEAVDWVLVMRRFDQDTLFDRMAESKALPPALMLELAEEIAFTRRPRSIASAAAMTAWLKRPPSMPATCGRRSRTRLPFATSSR